MSDIFPSSFIHTLSASLSPSSWLHVFCLSFSPSLSPSVCLSLSCFCGHTSVWLGFQIYPNYRKKTWWGPTAWSCGAFSWIMLFVFLNPKGLAGLLSTFSQVSCKEKKSSIKNSRSWWWSEGKIWGAVCAFVVFLYLSGPIVLIRWEQWSKSSKYEDILVSSRLHKGLN